MSDSSDDTDDTDDTDNIELDLESDEGEIECGHAERFVSGKIVTRDAGESADAHEFAAELACVSRASGYGRVWRRLRVRSGIVFFEKLGELLHI